MEETTTTTTGADTTATANAGSAESTAQPTGIFSQGLQFNDGWYESVQDPSFDEHRAIAAQYKDLPSVFKSLKDTKTALSQKTDGMVKIPGPQATPEEISAYRAAVGIPETPDKYEFKAPEKLPEGVEFKPDQLKAFGEAAHKLGLTPAQANGLIEFQAQAEGVAIAEYLQNQQVAETQAKQALASEFGNQYEAKMMLAQRGAQTLGLDPHAVKSSPDLARAMVKFAELTSESRLVSADEVKGSLSAGSQAKDIMTNPDNPFYASYHNGDQATIDKVMALLEQGN